MHNIKFLAVLLILIPFYANADERENCRMNRGDMNISAKCIESGIYDPCEDATTQSTIAGCGVSHTLVAEHRIDKSILTINKLFDKFKNPEAKLKFNESHEIWLKYRASYCIASDMLSSNAISHSKESILAMDTSQVFCEQRVTEEYASELELLIEKINAAL